MTSANLAYLLSFLMFCLIFLLRFIVLFTCLFRALGKDDDFESINVSSKDWRARQQLRRVFHRSGFAENGSGEFSFAPCPLGTFVNSSDSNYYDLKCQECPAGKLFIPDTTRFFRTYNSIGPGYYAALLFSGLGSIVLFFVLLIVFSANQRRSCDNCVLPPFFSVHVT